jgi:hypothetical protein
LTVPGFKASLAGGVGMLLLILISLFPIKDLPLWPHILVIPGLLIVWLGTGMLAGVLAGDGISSSHQGGKVGWVAGFWAGIYGGIILMILAAVEIILTGFGHNVAGQLAPELEGWGLTPDTVAMAARVFGALLVGGIMGSMISALFSSLGGMIYAKLVTSSSAQ